MFEHARNVEPFRTRIRLIEIGCGVNRKLVRLIFRELLFFYLLTFISEAMFHFISLVYKFKIKYKNTFGI